MADVILATADQVARVLGDLAVHGSFPFYGQNAAFAKLRYFTEEKTMSGASTAFTVLPAGALVLSVTGVVTTALTGASGFTLGDGSDADRYGDIATATVGSIATPATATAEVVKSYPTAMAITATAKTSNFTGGKIRVGCFYFQFQGPQN